MLPSQFATPILKIVTKGADMGLWDAADEVGKEIQQKREQQKLKEDAKQEAKEAAKQEQGKHKENKQQGMI